MRDWTSSRLLLSSFLSFVLLSHCGCRPQFVVECLSLQSNGQHQDERKYQHPMMMVLEGETSPSPPLGFLFEAYNQTHRTDSISQKYMADPCHAVSKTLYPCHFSFSFDSMWHLSYQCPLLAGICMRCEISTNRHTHTHPRRFACCGLDIPEVYIPFAAKLYSRIQSCKAVNLACKWDPPTI